MNIGILIILIRILSYEKGKIYYLMGRRVCYNADRDVFFRFFPMAEAGCKNRTLEVWRGLHSKETVIAGRDVGVR